MTPSVPSVLLETAALLMRNAEPGAPEAELAPALRTLLGETGADEDLHLSKLKAENDRLRTRLIEAQIAAEEAGDQARQDAIWAELRASTERRKISVSLV